MWIITVIGHRQISVIFTFETNVFRPNTKTQFRARCTGVSLFTVYNCLLWFLSRVVLNGTICVRKNDYHMENLLTAQFQFSFKTFNDFRSSLFLPVFLLLFISLLFFAVSQTIFLWICSIFIFERFSHTHETVQRRACAMLLFKIFSASMKYETVDSLIHSLIKAHSAKRTKNYAVHKPLKHTLCVEIYYSGKRKTCETHKWMN